MKDNTVKLSKCFISLIDAEVISQKGHTFLFLFGRRVYFTNPVTFSRTVSLSNKLKRRRKRKKLFLFPVDGRQLVRRPSPFSSALHDQPETGRACRFYFYRRLKISPFNSRMRWAWAIDLLCPWRQRWTRQRESSIVYTSAGFNPVLLQRRES